MAFDKAISNGNYGEVMHSAVDEVDLILAEGGQARMVITKKNNGTLPMLKLWRMWMAVVGPWMANNGATMPLCMKNGKPYGSRPFSPEDAHELFSSQFMPVDAYGERFSWVLNKDKNNGRTAADIGQRLRCMEQMQEWAIERGINLPIPERSEYYQQKNKTVE